MLQSLASPQDNNVLGMQLPSFRAVFLGVITGRCRVVYKMHIYQHRSEAPYNPSTDDVRRSLSLCNFVFSDRSRSHLGKGVVCTNAEQISEYASTRSCRRSNLQVCSNACELDMYCGCAYGCAAAFQHDRPPIAGTLRCRQARSCHSSLG